MRVMKKTKRRKKSFLIMTFSLLYEKQILD